MHRPIDLHLGIPLLQGLPAVVGPLAAGQAELDLGEAVAEVHTQGDEREPPLGRLAETTDVAEAVSFLLGPAGRSITGATLVVDAGSTA